MIGYFLGKLVNDRNLKLIDTVLKVDDEERVSLHSELRIDETDDSYRITPNVNFHLNGKPVIDLKGYALRQDGKKYSAEFTIDHISSQPIVISGKCIFL